MTIEMRRFPGGKKHDEESTQHVIAKYWDEAELTHFFPGVYNITPPEYKNPAGIYELSVEENGTGMIRTKQREGDSFSVMFEQGQDPLKLAEDPANRLLTIMHALNTESIPCIFVKPTLELPLVLAVVYYLPGALKLEASENQWFFILALFDKAGKPRLSEQDIINLALMSGAPNAELVKTRLSELVEAQFLRTEIHAGKTMYIRPDLLLRK